MIDRLSFDKILVQHRNVGFEISSFLRRGQRKEVIVFFHGLGSDKYDFLNAVYDRRFDDFTIFAFDFPGSGNSSYDESLKLDVTDLVEISAKVLSIFKLGDMIIVGHSLGGLVALLFAVQYTDKVKAFINIEGNLAPEDCAVFSRKTAGLNLTEFREQNFMQKIADEFSRLPYPGARIFADRFQRMVKEAAFHYYCVSIVELSDSEQLLEKYKRLRVPRLLIHGDVNSSLSYLDEIAAAGIDVTSVPDGYHWPHYDNPDFFYNSVHKFISDYF